MKPKTEKGYDLAIAVCLTAYILLIADYFFKSFDAIFGATTIFTVRFPALCGMVVCAGFGIYHLYRRIRFKEYNWFLLSPLPSDVVFLLLFLILYIVPAYILA